jgi:hypothetical protein
LEELACSLKQEADPQEYNELIRYLEASLQADHGDVCEAGSSPISAPAVLTHAADQLRQALNGPQNEELLLPGGKAALGEQGVKERPAGVQVTPRPGFVVKTRILASSTDGRATEQLAKVFLNVCEHDLVHEPDLQKRLDAEGNEVEVLNVPMRCVNNLFD